MQEYLRIRSIILVYWLASAGQFFHATDGQLLVSSGCWDNTDIDAEDVLQFAAGISSPLNTTAAECASACGFWEFSLSGVRDGSYCVCGETEPIAAESGNVLCITGMCSGDNTVVCGGDGITSVYFSIIPMKEIQLRIDILSAYLSTPDNTFAHINFDLFDENAVYEVDLGDGLGLQVVNGSFTRHLPVPGDQLIRGKMTNQVGLVENDYNTVSIHHQFVQSAMSCPEYIPLGDDLECQFTFVGGNSVTINDTVNIYTISAEEFAVVGPRLPLNGSAIEDGHHGAVSQHQAQIQMDGRLVAWHFYAFSGGDVKFRVLKPNCNTDYYCYADNSCMADVSVNCTYDEFDCADFCPADLACCASADVDRFSGTTLTYTVIHEQDVTIPSSGEHVIAADPDMTVQPGDVMGFMTGTGRIGRLVSGDLVDEEMSSFFRAHLLQAIVSPTTEGVIIRHALTPGLQQVEVVLSDDVTGHTSVLTSNTTVQQRIDGISFTQSDYNIPSYEDYVFELNPHTGDSLVYTWNIGNGVNETAGSTFTHSFNNSECLTLRISAENQISSATNTTSVCANDRLGNITLLISSPNPILNETINITVSLTAGTNFTCDLYDNLQLLATLDEADLCPVCVHLESLTLTSAGEHVIRVDCTNPVTDKMTNLTLDVPVDSRISQIEFITEGAAEHEVFNLTWTLDGGDNVICNVTIDGTHQTGVVIYDLQTMTYTYTVSTLPSGTHEIKVLAENAVNSMEFNTTIIIDVPVSGINIDVPWPRSNIPFLQALSEGTTLNLSSVAGTNIQGSVDWGDGDVENITSFPTTVSHNYTIEGNYTVTIQTWNYAGTTVETFQLVYISPLRQEDVQIEVISTTLNTLQQVEMDFIVSATPGAVYTPEQMTMTIEAGDDQPNMNAVTELDQQHTIIYTAAGDYTVRVNLTNAAGEMVSLTYELPVLSPIVNMVVTVVPRQAVLNEPVQVQVFMDAGDNVTITWMFGDVLNTQNQRPKNASVERESFTYTSVGSYVITIMAENDLGGVNKTISLLCERPIRSDYFSVTTNTPIVFPDPLVITVIYNGTALDFPSSPSILISYGNDTNNITEGALVFGALDSVNYTFTYDKPIETTGSVTIYNQVTTITIFFEAGVYEAISGATADLFWRSLLPLDAPLQAPVDNGSMIFPSGQKVVYNISTTTGAPFCTEIVANNQGALYVCEATNGEIMEQIYDEPGYYEVNITVSNGISSTLISYDIIIKGMTTAPQVLGLNELTKPGEPLIMTVEFSSVGSDGCLIVNYGDSPLVEYYSMPLSPIGLLGDSLCPTDQPIVSNVTNPLILNHTYAMAGRYTLTITLSQPIIGDQNFTENIYITNSVCQTPRLQIEDQRPLFYSPTERVRSQLFTMLAKTDFKCPESLQHNKLWKIFRVDPNSGVRLSVVNMGGVSTRHTAQLVMPKLYLPLGLYEFEYSVVMAQLSFDGTNFTTTATTYVKITKSELIGRIMFGGLSRVTRSWGQLVNFEPSIYTVDPDESIADTPANITSFLWFCRRASEIYPKNPITGQEITTLMDLPRDSNDVLIDLGGCFGNGPGTIDIQGGIWSLNTSLLHKDESYEFMVLITALDGREASSQVIVDVQLTSAQPIISVRCADGGLCHQTSLGQRVNPTNRLALWSHCSGDVCHPPISFHWNIYSRNEFHFWERIPHSNNYIMGDNSQGIGVRPSLFTEYMDDEEFKVEVIVSAQDVDGIVGVGSADIVILRNKVPSGGNCSISPRSVNSSSMPFNVSCNGWTDDSQIKIYEVYVIQGNESTTLVYYASTLDSVQLKLPTGSPYHDFFINVTVKVIDIDLAFTEVNLGKVQVLRTSMTTAYQQVTTLLGNTLEFETIMARGEIQETSSEILRLVSLLNQVSIAAAQTAADYDEVAAETVATSDMQTVMIEDVQELEDYTSEQEKQQWYEETRSELAHVREAMIEGLENIGTGSMESLVLVSGAITAISSSPHEITQTAQTSAAALTARLADQLLTHTEDVPQEQLVQVAENIAISIQQMFESSAQQLENPIASDLENAKNSWYYDTNLESTEPWMNAGSEDDNLYSLSKYTTDNIQKDVSSEVIPMGLDTLNTITEALLANAVPGESNIVIENTGLKMLIDKNTVGDLSNRTWDLGSSSIDVPEYCQLRPQDCTEDISQLVISVKVISLSRNPFTHTSKKPDQKKQDMVNSTSVARESGTIIIDYYDVTNEKLVIENTQSDVSIVMAFAKNLTLTSIHYLPLKPEKEIFVLEIRLVIANDPLLTPDTKVIKKQATGIREDYLIHEVIDLHTNNVSIIVEIANFTQEFTMVMFFAKFYSAPNPGTGDFEAMYTIDVSNSSQESVSVIINQELVAGRTGQLYLGLGPLIEGKDPSMVTDNDYRPILVPNATFTYYSHTHSAGCYFFDETANAMSDYGCKVGSRSSSASIECFCNHMTSYAGGWIVAPNTIDFTELNFDPRDNPTIYITIGVITALYLVVIIWARRKDRKDMQQLGCLPMNTNDPLDKYLYEVIVSTGSRKGAGTKSQIYTMFSGEYDETDVRPLNDGGRTILQRAQIDSWLMAVPRPLGQLHYARIWHDNRGKGQDASWFVNYIMVHDLQTKERFHFVMGKWLALEEEDGLIDRVIPIAGRDDMTKFSHLFSETTKKDFTDGHLWFSVFMRPPQSRFTRVQRVSSCLLLLYLSMVTSGMFYDKSPAKGIQTGLAIGPFTLTPEQISIGVMTNLIIFPVSLLVIQLFRKSKLRKKRKSHLKQAIIDNITNNHGGLYYPTMRGYSQPRHGRNIINASKKKSGPFLLPWWCRIIAWLVLWIGVLTSMTFTFLYALQFGDDVTASWLSSMVVSFLTSVLVTQPVKVLLMAVFFSLVIRKPKVEDDDTILDEENLELEFDEEWLNIDKSAGHHALKARHFNHSPVDPAKLEDARKHRMKEVAMYDILREIMLYMVFFLVLVTVSYSSHDINSFNVKKNMENHLVKPGDIAYQDYKKIKNVTNFWYWTKNTLIPGVRAQNWYNGQPPVGQRGFFDDRVSRIMGYAVIRQLRMGKYSCSVAEELSGQVYDCIDEYDFHKHDTQSYGRQWSHKLPGDADAPEYTFHKASELEGYPYAGRIGLYSGGGYVWPMRGDVASMLAEAEQLERDAWIDRYTRAVFVEFTVYNTNVNLFTICTFLLEMPHSGGIIPVYRFNPARLIQFYGSAMIFQIVCQAAFVLFIFSFIVKEARKLHKTRKKYFSELWNYVELSVIILAISCVAIFIIRLVEMNTITNKFKETNGNAYMKFQYVSGWNEVFSYLLAMLVFITMIKFIRLLRFNKRMSLLSDTLKHAGKQLWLFSIMYLVIFFTFVLFFHITLLREMPQFSTFKGATETCISMMLGKFDFGTMTKSNELSPIFFLLFIVVNVFILLNMFLSIISESFTVVKHDIDQQSNEHEVIDYILSRFIQWTTAGKKGNQDRTVDEQIVQAAELDKVEEFSVKIERLMSSLKKVYVEGDQYDQMIASAYDKPVAASSKKAAYAAAMTQRKRRGY